MEILVLCSFRLNRKVCHFFIDFDLYRFQYSGSHSSSNSARSSPCERENRSYWNLAEHLLEDLSSLITDADKVSITSLHEHEDHRLTWVPVELTLPDWFEGELCWRTTIQNLPAESRDRAASSRSQSPAPASSLEDRKDTLSKHLVHVCFVVCISRKS